MTTIAFRDGILAADTLYGRGEFRGAGRQQKIFRTRDGIAGITGVLAEGVRIVDWLRSDKPVGECPIASKEVTVIHVRRDDVIDIHEDGGVYQADIEFMAWGSGMSGALGALYMGAGAAEAVRIASLIDPWTGGEVAVLELAPVLHGPFPKEAERGNALAERIRSGRFGSDWTL